MSASRIRLDTRSIDEQFAELDARSRKQALNLQDSLKLEQLVREIDYRDQCAAQGRPRRG